MSANGLPQGYRIQELEIFRELGEGGFGITYLAYDHQLDRQVALKEYYPYDCAVRRPNGEVACRSERYTDLFEWGRKSFQLEAQTLSKLKHANIVRVSRLLDHNGTCYFVMDYVEGEPLEDVLKREKKLSAKDTRRILEMTLAGLAEAHALSILHRDIKPGNILIELTGEPVLIDFGAARQVAESRSKPITAIVSEHYAPFELYETEAQAQGPWSDIYSISAVGYFALTGRLPPKAPDRIRKDSFQPLDVNAYDDRGLCKAINAGLKMEPRDRPGDIDAWLEIAGSSMPDGSQRARRGPAKLPGPQYTKVRNTELRPQGVSHPALRREPGRFPGWLPFAGGVLVLLLVVGGFILLPPHPGGDSPLNPLTPAPVAPGPMASNVKFPECTSCPNMVVVPAGDFMMDHNPSNEPPHRVTIRKRFAISTTEVTVGQWQACAAASVCKDIRNLTEKALVRIDPSDASMPVREVTYPQIRQYYEWLSSVTKATYRLPTEAEWEYAAHGGKIGQYPWDANGGPADANCDGCGANSTNTAPQNVGQRRPNSFGLYDLAGNVWEMVGDCASESVIRTPIDGSAYYTDKCPARILKGGAYYSKPNELRISTRKSFATAENGADLMHEAVGFRVVREMMN